MDPPRTVDFVKYLYSQHDDVIKWKHLPRYWSFVRRIHRSPVNSPHKGQWREALTFALICVWINGWVNNGEAGDLRRPRTHYDVIVMKDHHTRPRYKQKTLWLFAVCWQWLAFVNKHRIIKISSTQYDWKNTGTKWNIRKVKQYSCYVIYLHAV